MIDVSILTASCDETARVWSEEETLTGLFCSVEEQKDPVVAEPYLTQTVNFHDVENKHSVQTLALFYNIFIIF